MNQNKIWKFLLKFIVIAFYLILFYSCKNQNNYRELGNGTWGVRTLKYKDSSLLGGDESLYGYGGNYLTMSLRYKKLLLEVNTYKEMTCDIKLHLNKEKDSIEIFNSIEPIYNGKYSLTLDTVERNVFGTRYRLTLKSDNILVLANRFNVENNNSEH